MLPITVIRHLGDSPMANAARMNVSAMVKAGAVVKEMGINVGNNYDVVYHHGNPGELSTDYSAKKRIAYWTWEINDFLPDEWLVASQRYNQIWVPSHFVKHNLISGGVDEDKIKIIPCFATFGSMVQPPIHELKFVNISTGGHSLERENPLGAIAAFKDAFQKDEAVSLTIKANNLHLDDEHRLLRLIGNDSRITLIEGSMDNVETYRLLTTHHAFISLHRSISFGSMMLNCMALGLPVIATMCGGNQEFCHWIHEVSYSAIPANNRGYEGGTWGDPDIADASYQMYATYIHIRSPKVRELTLRAYADTLARYNFLATVQAVKLALNELV